MPSTNSLPRLFADLAHALDGRAWCLIGAQAAIVYGSTRATADVDVSVAVADHELAALLSRFGASGFAARIDDPIEFAIRSRVLLLAHADGTPVDLVIAGPGLEQDFLQRARRIELGERIVPVIAPEDLVASKLLAGRPRDVDDTIAVVRRQPRLDIVRIRQLLRLFEQALDRGDLLPELDRILTAAGRTP